MKNLKFSVLLFLINPIFAHSWDRTGLDTVEVTYDNGRPKEQYQTLYWGGREETGKYGFYRSWYENGQMKWEGQYGGNVKIGTWINWDSTGRRVTEVSYKRGQKHGDENEWNPDGTFRKELHYRNDKLHGLCTWRKSGNIVNDFFNNPNLVIDSQSFYINGKVLVNVQNKDTPTSMHPYEGPRLPNYNEELELWWEWTSRAASMFVGQKVDNKKDGLWISWTSSGEMEKVELYEMGELLLSK